MKNMFKKTTLFLLLVTMIFLTACGNGIAKKTSQPKLTAQSRQALATQQTQTKPSAPYITTAKGFTESILSRSRVEPATFEQAKTLGIVPAEVKPDSVLTRAQASYIMWNAIKKIDYLRVKNIPVSTAVYDLWESYLSGKDVVLNPGYCTMAAYQFFDFLRYEITYADGTKDVKFVYNPILLNGKCAMDNYDTVRQLVQTFKKKYPQQLKISIPKRPNIKVLKNVKRVLNYRIKRSGAREPSEVVQGDLYYIFFERNKVPYYYILENGEKVQYKPVTLFYTAYKPQRDMKLKDYTDTNDKYILNFIMPKIDPRYNQYIYNWLKSLPRRYKYYDYRRFEVQGYIEDIKSIPQLYKEPVLRMFDLGIYIWDKSPFYFQKVRAVPGKTLTEQEANELLDRLFDKKKRDVFDEFSNRAALYMTPEGDVICGLTNLGKVDDLKMDPWDLESVISELDGAVFDTQIVTLRLLPGVAREFKNTVKEDPDIKEGVVPQLSMAFASRLGLDLGDYYFYGLYFTLFGTPVTHEKSGLPGIVAMPIKYLVTPKMVAASMGPIPEAYEKQIRNDAKYYYSEKTKALLPGKPGVIVQYGDIYLYMFAVKWPSGATGFLNRTYYEKPDIPGAKFVVAKPDKNYK